MEQLLSSETVVLGSFADGLCVVTLSKLKYLRCSIGVARKIKGAMPPDF